MMLTRCPGCTTTFRITPEQVKARHGKVRCGRCQNVFDAIEHLVETPKTVPATAPAPPPPVPQPEAIVVPNEAPAADVAVQVAEPAPLPSPSSTSPPAPEPAAAVEESEPLPSRALSLDADTQPPEPESDDILLQPSPLSSTYAPTRTVRQPSWPWTIAATLLGLVLIAQLLIAFRVDLAVKHPEIRPLLDMLCEQADCVVELPSDPDMVSIETSDLHPAKRGGLELTATLRNRATHAQAWPHLELTLTDGADKPIVRKVIAPEQYLPATQTEADGFTANGEQAVQLLLDAGTLPAAGYRLYLFYP